MLSAVLGAVGMGGAKGGAAPGAPAGAGGGMPTTLAGAENFLKAQGPGLMSQAMGALKQGSAQGGGVGRGHGRGPRGAGGQPGSQGGAVRQVGRARDPVKLRLWRRRQRRCGRWGKTGHAGAGGGRAEARGHNAPSGRCKVRRKANADQSIWRLGSLGAGALRQQAALPAAGGSAAAGAKTHAQTLASLRYTLGALVADVR